MFALTVFVLLSVLVCGLLVKFWSGWRWNPDVHCGGRSGTAVDRTKTSESKPRLKPKHNIFLSHSGVQKSFTEQLCKDLENANYFPFFDLRDESLPKGEYFAPLLLEAAQQCCVAILVLSEEFFTRSRWPMIELNEFVQAQETTNCRLKILPLFFGLNLKQLKDARNQKRWKKIWQGWANDDVRRGTKDDKCIDVEKWVQALSKVLHKPNAMEYDAIVREVKYRENVVAAVCKLVPPDVKYDVSDVQALPQLIEAISQKMNEKVEPSPTPACRVVGLFGMGGVGKTTISKAMCNENFGEFGGKVCHVELGGNNLVELRKKVLQELTGANQDYLPNELDKLLGLLKDRMQHPQQKKVFLTVDNVLSASDIEEAKMYLYKVMYKHGSKVLVTSRSLDVLKSLKLKECDCMEMPELKREDATKLFLHYTHTTSQNDLNEDQRAIIIRCVEACKFGKRDIGSSGFGSSSWQYLPLALKVWGIQLGHISEDPLRWVESLENLSKHKFNHFKEPDHPLFSLLRQGYDALDPEDQHIFMDLALFLLPYNGHPETKYNVGEWLCTIHRCDKASIERSLIALRRKALLEDSGFKIHDLYLEFAREEARVGPFVKRRILYDLKGIDIPFELQSKPADGLWSCLERLRISKSEVNSLKKAKFERCSNVKVMQLDDCKQLVEVDVQGIEYLRSLDVVGCKELMDKFVGVEKLEDLVWFRWRDIVQPAPFLRDLSSLTALQVLHLHCEYQKEANYISRTNVPSNLSGCTNLRELTMDLSTKIQSLPDLSNLFKLQKIFLARMSGVKSISGLSSLTSLKELSVYCLVDLIEVPGLSKLTNLKNLEIRRCGSLKEVPGLCDLASLETLDCNGASLSKLHNLSKLGHLRQVLMYDCRDLTSLLGLEYSTSLQHLDARLCKNLKVLPDFSNLKKLDLVNLSDSGIYMLPSDFGRLAKRHILKIKNCGMLFEPLVVWFLEQQQHVVKRLDGWSSIDFPFAEQTESQLRSNIKEVFDYYVDTLNLLQPDNFVTLPPRFPLEEILSSPHVLGEMEAGVENLIRTLCEHNDMGILSLIVAKYAASEKCWALLTAESSIQALSGRIVQFIDQQVEAMEPAGNPLGWVKNLFLLSRMQFIIEHVTKNQIMARALGDHKICSLIERLSDPQACDIQRPELIKSLVDMLERCKVGDLGEVYPNI